MRYRITADGRRLTAFVVDAGVLLCEGGERYNSLYRTSAHLHPVARIRHILDLLGFVNYAIRAA